MLETMLESQLLPPAAVGFLSDSFSFSFVSAVEVPVPAGEPEALLSAILLGTVGAAFGGAFGGALGGALGGVFGGTFPCALGGGRAVFDGGRIVELPDGGRIVVAFGVLFDAEFLLG